MCQLRTSTASGSPADGLQVQVQHPAAFCHLQVECPSGYYLITIANYNHIISSLFENPIKTRFNLPPGSRYSESFFTHHPRNASDISNLNLSSAAEVPKSGQFEITKVKFVAVSVSLGYIGRVDSLVSCGQERKERRLGWGYLFSIRRTLTCLD